MIDNVCISKNNFGNGLVPLKLQYKDNKQIEAQVMEKNQQPKLHHNDNKQTNTQIVEENHQPNSLNTQLILNEQNSSGTKQQSSCR